ncbi:MAG TPA: putative lipid II flippase FtsW [Bdellovibrionales bacterium]|nr:putative lipid II flippase FtsW [Bdellovibrionales bacterium]
MTRIDRGLLLAIFALLGIGLVQVYSSSFIFAIESRGDGLFFFKRQFFFSLLAIAVLLTTAQMPYRLIQKFGWLLWIAAAFGIAATMVPGLGIKAGGAARWLNLPGGFVFEPSELLKISLPLLLATYFSRRFEAFGDLDWPIRAAVFMLPLLLVLRQPDFGTFAICSAVFIAILFSFGLKWRYVIGTFAVAIPAFYFLVMNVPYRRMRILAFLDPWADPEQKGFQVIQSMLSFQSGGLTGVGLGQGQGKLFFLPEAHTDFTMAVLGEEMGFIGFMIVISLYGYLVFRGLQLAARAEDHFSKVLALGLSLTFGFSVFINMGVVMGLLPTKGLTLPFLSYGGSSLLMTCFLFGLLLNVERHDREAVPVGRKAQRLLRRKR